VNDKLPDDLELCILATAEYNSRENSKSFLSNLERAYFVERVVTRALRNACTLRCYSDRSFIFGPAYIAYACSKMLARAR